MSGSVSPLPWTGNKGCIYTTIDAFMPPHRTYVEACMGSAEVFLRKKPVEKEIINDYNGDLVRFFRVLQRNENLERLIGRLFLSFNSEQIFRANKALLAEVPNILDDLTETSVIIENTQWNDFDLAVAFYENQVFSFSSTGKNFAITKKDMLAAALGITEDTLFETYFDGNCLRVRTLDEEEVESAILAGLEDAFDD